MKCLRCGYCCLNSFVVVVDDPDKGLIDGNLKVVESTRCQHLIGDKPGEYSCAVHDRPWYKETPCFSHGQIENNKDCDCRLGAHILKRIKK